MSWQHVFYNDTPGSVFTDRMYNPLMYQTSDPYNYRRPFITSNQSEADLLFSDRTNENFVFYPVPDATLTNRGPMWNYTDELDSPTDLQPDFIGSHPGSVFKRFAVPRGDSLLTYVGVPQPYKTSDREYMDA